LADWAFGFPTSDWPWMICRCRLDSSTTSNSTMPSVPTPAAARYSRAGLPRPPAPTTRTLAFFSRFCPAMPTSGMMMWREKRRTSSTVSSAAGSTSGGRVTGRLLGSRTTVSCVNPSAPGRVPSAPRASGVGPAPVLTGTLPPMSSPAAAAPAETARGTRLSRPARRQQLLSAAQEVFVASGYHATAMDEIADRAGVSKPVLYQHFPSKLELYLAVLDRHVDALVAAVRNALEVTHDNKQRVAGVTSAFFEFVDTDGEAFRLVFESDLTSEPLVRDRVARMTAACAEPISVVIAEDTGLPAEQARMLGIALVGQAQVTARWWLTNGRPIPREDAARLVFSLSWRGIRGFPKSGA
jgi:AcrR family transcriptional regulator